MINFSDFKNELETSFSVMRLTEFAGAENTEKFYLLACELENANNEFNLTAIREPREVIVKHFADSLLAAHAFPDKASVVDVGCGGGFPCLPLAIARPDLKLTGLDSTAKKLGFVAACAKKLSLDVKTLNMRAEDAGRDPTYREHFDAATARAVARLNILCELCLPLVRRNGSFVAMKAASTPAEISEAKSALSALGGKITGNDERELVCDGETQRRSIIIMQKVSVTPKIYPRNYAQINKKPL